jgi:hypothetical protein
LKTELTRLKEREGFAGEGWVKVMSSIRTESSGSKTVRRRTLTIVALTLCAALCLLVVSACAAGVAGNAIAAPARPVVQAPYPGTDDGARALIEKLGTVGDAALLASLQPTTADYNALFKPDFAVRAEQYYQSHIWAAGPPAQPLARPGQTQVRIWSSTTEDVKAWTPAARANVPGGYEKIRDQLMPGLLIYAWDYIKPGDESGMAYNGLVFVNEHWAFFPKPWHVLKA